MLDNVNVWRNLGAALVPAVFLTICLFTAGIEPLMAVKAALWLAFLGWLFACVIDFFYIGAGNDAIENIRERNRKEYEVQTIFEVTADGGKTWQALQTHMDETQLHTLFDNMLTKQEGVYAEGKRPFNVRAYTDWDIRQVMPELKKLGWAHQVGGRNKWVLTPKGEQIARRYLSTEPPEGVERVKVRI